MSGHLLFYSNLRHVRQKFGFAQTPFLLTLRHRGCLAVDVFHVVVSREGSTRGGGDAKVLDPVITQHFTHHCRQQPLKKKKSAGFLGGDEPKRDHFV